MSKQYNCKPSEIMCIEEEYASYCFNEACCQIIIRLSNGEKAYYKDVITEHTMKQNYNSFSDFYKDFGG